MPRTPLKRAVDTHYTKENGQFSCIYCKWSFRGGQLRRKLEHLLDIGTTVAGCSNRDEMDGEEVKKLKKEYDDLNKRRDGLNLKKKLLVEEADKIEVPGRQGRINMDKDKIDMEYCRLMVMTTVRSTFLDSPFSNLFFLNNFGYQRPSRTNVYRYLLPVLYEDTKEKIMKELNFDDPDTLCTIATDGWEAPNGTHLRNYLIVQDGNAFLHSCTNSGSKKMDAKAIADEMLKVIEDIGPENVAAVTTDNASVETTSWDNVMEEHPHILCTGCAAHGGSLLFKDICKHKWAASLSTDVSFLATFLRRHQWITAQLREQRAKMVTMHCSTRFAGIYFTMSRLLELQTPISQIVISREYQERRYDKGDKAYDLVVDQNFWVRIRTFLAIMKPVKDFIRMMDATRHMTEHFHIALDNIRDEWTEMRGNSTGMKGHCLKVLKERWKWMEFPIHSAAFALSPYYHGEAAYGNTTVMSGLHYILERFSDAEGVSHARVEAEFSKYRKKPNNLPIFPPTAQNLKDPAVISSKEWWQLHGHEWPHLQPVAIRVFSVGTSTSTSERNWSTMGHIWNSRSANRTFNAAAKVAYCNFNINALYRKNVQQQINSHMPADSSEDESSSSDNDDDDD